MILALRWAFPSTFASCWNVAAFTIRTVASSNICVGKRSKRCVLKKPNWSECSTANKLHHDSMGLFISKVQRHCLSYANICKCQTQALESSILRRRVLIVLDYILLYGWVTMGGCSSKEKEMTGAQRVFGKLFEVNTIENGVSLLHVFRPWGYLSWLIFQGKATAAWVNHSSQSQFENISTKSRCKYHSWLASWPAHSTRGNNWRDCGKAQLHTHHRLLIWSRWIEG